MRRGALGAERGHLPRLALGLLSALGIACGGGGGGGSTPGPLDPPGPTRPPTPAGGAPLPHPPPLPVTLVDAARFPQNLADRYETPPGPGGQPSRTSIHVSVTGDDAGTGSTSSPMRTIRHALEAVRSGGTGAVVVVHGGTYVEGDPLDSEHMLRLDTAWTTVVEAAGETAVVRPTSGVRYGLEIAASHVTWSGVDVVGVPEDSIDVHDGRSPARTLEDIVLADVLVDVPTDGTPNNGIVVVGNQRAAGLPLVRGLRIERVTVLGAAISIQVADGPVEDVVMEAVVVRGQDHRTGNSGFDAIAVEDGDNILINGADVADAEADGIDTKASHVSVVNADVRSGRNGIKMWRGGEIINSLVHDTDADAAVVFGRDVAPVPGAPPDAYRIVNSTIAFHNRRSGGTAYAMTCGYDSPSYPQTLELVNTVFYRNSARWIASAGTSLTIRNCCFFGPDEFVAELRWDGRSSVGVLASDPASSLSPYAATSGVLPFTSDPLFVDPEATGITGFELSAQSPLLDAATVLAPAPSVDLRGRPRNAGPGVDIGPLERP